MADWKMYACGWKDPGGREHVEVFEARSKADCRATDLKSFGLNAVVWEL